MYFEKIGRRYCQFTRNHIHELDEMVIGEDLCFVL